jgi:excisionase family DNA binding protein
VAEAAWVLNVSDSQMYEWIDEGMLERVPGTPLRVTPDSVQRLLLPES